MRNCKAVIIQVLDCSSIAEKSWNFNVFCDSDWAGDLETRISVTGFIVYLMVVPVSWRSKAQRGVTLSSNKAEYVAIESNVECLVGCV
jgi:hypothetical protein